MVPIPMTRVAAIDVGSNAARLLVVELSPAGRVRRSEFQRYAVKLGADVFSMGHIGDARREELGEVFADMARRMEAAGVVTLIQANVSPYLTGGIGWMRYKVFFEDGQQLMGPGDDDADSR